MITNRELMIGNKINYITLEGVKECVVDSYLFNELEPHNGSGSSRMYYPINLTKEWVVDNIGDENILPKNIKHIHEAQNWLFFNSKNTQ